VQNQLFEAAFGIAKPWYVNGVDFDAAKKILTISVDYVAGTRFPAAGVRGRASGARHPDQAPAASQFLPARMQPAGRIAHSKFNRAPKYYLITPPLAGEMPLCR
jgi:hypothetical protein